MKVTPQAQQKLNDLLFNLVCGMGSSFNAIKNPIIVDVLQQLSPGFKIPSRKDLSGRLLTKKDQEVMKEVEEALKGKMVTLLLDGWNNCARDHLFAFVATCEGKSYVFSVHNTTSKDKTGDAALLLIEDEIEMLGKKGIEVVAVISDDGGDMRKARKSLLAKRPQLTIEKCFAHQLNLVVGNIFKGSPYLKDISQRMLAVIVWFTNHSKAMSLLLSQARRDDPKFGPTTFIHPAPTRWTSHWAAACHLRQWKAALHSVCFNMHSKVMGMAGAGTKNRQTAQTVLDIALEKSFWDGLDDLITILSPLTISTYVLQANTTTLDMVFFEFGKLYTHFVPLQTLGSRFVRDAAAIIIQSLEKRWAAADQDVFIACALLNPFFGLTRVGISNNALPGNMSYALIKSLWIRFFPEETSHQTLDHLSEEWSAYYHRKPDPNLRRYTNAVFDLQGEAEKAKRNNSPLDPAGIWRLLGNSVSSPLIRLTLRLFAAVPNSAACEP
ncbi:hypothetical protein L202_02696 [Cryptococcus amylolentus CBS 6039]|uniref:DUF659 domain-containing protein n=1 Tax=Cryptococcus amylolentus CBS 6039 TaxID=1295533 RepID=A0A1E3HXG0_9TREE|nr:hypothetical protein L202_02696 [Cryptococcus amylolentus CBS 6039]ODN80456.1 hypothetical protein L202_02696 [Cryptococcus amylolentus CBS 6039]